MPYSLPPLPYDYGALEPSIDKQTMQLHHDKHHQAYIDNLNKALADHPQLADLPIEELLARISEVPESIRTAVRNNGGGHANHDMFWKIMKPGGSQPSGDLKTAIDQSFGSFDAFKTKFEDAGVKQFGSGWVFLLADPSSKRLELVSRPNQDSPLMDGRSPVIGNDVWEHAYYLKYQNRRAEYLKAWWNVVNWDYANERYQGILAGKKQL